MATSTSEQSDPAIFFLKPNVSHKSSFGLISVRFNRASVQTNVDPESWSITTKKIKTSQARLQPNDVASLVKFSLSPPMISLRLIYKNAPGV